MNIALLFVGQGTKITQQVKELWLNNAEAKELIETAERQLDYPIGEWLTSDLSTDTHKAQLAAYVGSMCMYQLYKQTIGLYPSYVLGHSLGELTALTIAGAVTYEDGLKLVDIRGRAMKEAIAGQDSLGMMAVFAAPEVVEALVTNQEGVYAANFNSLHQTVISGTRQGIQDFMESNQLEGVKLAVNGAFHTPYMKEAADQVYEQLGHISFNTDLQTQVISNKSAGLYDMSNIRAEIASQIVSPVRWKQSIDYAIGQGIQLFVDLSPNGMFVNMLKNLEGVFAFNTTESIEVLRSELKDDIEVNRHYDVFSRALGIIVSTKNNSTDAEAYENIVMSGYNRIKSQIGKEASGEDIKQTLSLLDLILSTKEVPVAEITEYRNMLAWKIG
ncbi:ACP S-malonyltransferase [Paenibacillus sp. 19GGS1-52]|uniref:ACP S-malonyltransferase n=1 Tax=Paenibacillus sp. 19GGS1-52 TaxID=2758563 RepID=UPI001EFB1A54|nr:ACP S-malonyltransferase [Paenibacillus sp. 19GGS1-52]ULO08713.1 ACP S-malonyltransferase [Paenibacillus sp. 19GGS1-52]